MAQIEKMIAKTFMDIATGLETGSFGARPRIAVTGLGSEHGEANSVAAAELAADRGVDVTLIGTAENEKFNTVKVADEDEMYREMEKMLDNGDIDGCVTMHYPFPIGVSTVGRVVTPGKGKQMFIACADEWQEIVNLQISGKKRMNANDFLNGMRTIEDYHCTNKK